MSQTCPHKISLFLSLAQSVVLYLPLFFPPLIPLSFSPLLLEPQGSNQKQTNFPSLKPHCSQRPVYLHPPLPLCQSFTLISIMQPLVGDAVCALSRAGLWLWLWDDEQVAIWAHSTGNCSWGRRCTAWGQGMHMHIHTPRWVLCSGDCCTKSEVRKNTEMFTLYLQNTNVCRCFTFTILLPCAARGKTFAMYQCLLM